MNFYTNVQVYGSKILYRGFENGRRVSKRVDYNPTLFIPSKEATKYTTIHGDYVAPISFGNIRETKETLRQYEDVPGFLVYGNTRFEYCYISDNFDEVKWDRNLITKTNFDIEVASENGFPEPEHANEEIVSITMKTNTKFVALGTQPFVNKDPEVTYIQCRDEIHLLKTFLDYWTAEYPDVITGWFIRFFDIPYLVNRLIKLFGEKEAKRLSPWGIIREKIIDVQGREEQTYVLVGCSVLDGAEMYKKFVPGGASKASYKLGDICQEEIGEGKLSYEEYGSLHTLYKDNYQKFIEYNIQDVRLVEKLDAKHKMIDLVITLCYDNKCNFDDAFQQVRMWDALAYNKLKSMNMVVPQAKRTRKSEQYPGAYVKDPDIGKYEWVVSEDLDSLYPHLIMQYNISPDKFVEPADYTEEMREFIAKNKITVDALLHKEIDLEPLRAMGVTLTPNGQFFKTDKPGFLTELMIAMYEDRKMYKKKANAAKKAKEAATDPVEIARLTNEIAVNNNMQLAKKVTLNSAYGALGSEYFRFFDVRQAAAITTAGQLSIRWIEHHLNAFFQKILKDNKDRVIAIDTDSVYLCLKDLVEAVLPEGTTEQKVEFVDKLCETKIADLIEKKYQALATYTNSLQQRMHMKREAIADAGVWTAKKRYALSVWDLEGVRYKKPIIKVTGLEVVRSSTPPKCKERLKDGIEIALHGTQDQMFEFIDTFRDEFMKLTYQDVALAKGVNGMKTYYSTGAWVDKTPGHVKAAMMYNRFIDKYDLGKKYQKIKDGDKIKLLYLREPNPAHVDMIAYPTLLPPEFDMEKYIDWNHQFEMAFLKPLRAILNAMNWSDEKVTSFSSFWESA